jgi:hypothetical protein
MSPEDWKKEAQALGSFSCQIFGRREVVSWKALRT